MEENKDDKKIEDLIVDSDKTVEEEKADEKKSKIGWGIFFAVLFLLIIISILVIEFVK